jgi:RHS repeat-associated protein
MDIKKGQNIFHYKVKDHLGNVRVTTTDVKLSQWNNTKGVFESFEANVTDSYNYFPFGMEMPGRNTTGGEKYRYGFNGKEKDETGEWGNSTTAYDFGSRIYNPALGRWFSPDPEKKKAHNWTPYRFGFDNPIQYKDPNGKWEEDGHFWTVYALGIAMGLPKKTAFEIAAWAEYPDHIVTEGRNGALSFTLNGHWGGGGLVGVGTWLDEKLQMDYHGLSDGPQVLENMRASNNIFAGQLQYLHLLGDSWAHSYINEKGERVMYGKRNNNPAFFSIEAITRAFFGDVTLEHALGGPNGDIADNIKDRPVEYKSYVDDLVMIIRNPHFVFSDLVRNINPDLSFFKYIPESRGNKYQNIILFNAFIEYWSKEFRYDWSNC